MDNKVVLFWFRRDLRLEDNAGLAEALQSGYKVLPVFIFDEEILSRLDDKYDRRVDYIHQALAHIREDLATFGSSIKTCFGKPLEVFKKLFTEHDIAAVYCNRDYEPQAIKRDMAIKKLAEEKGAGFYDFKDQVIFEHRDILKADGMPYTIYTPYSNKWKASLTPADYSARKWRTEAFEKLKALPLPGLEAIGFEKTDITFTVPVLNAAIIDSYDQYRDFPAMDHTTHLGIALRFGTISIRKCVAFALEHNQTWLNELIWREFFMQILFHFPKVVTHSFKAKYDHIKWRNNEEEFERWCNGETGYPIVDAGMKQLNATGRMHNRVRMIVASFLCKHLLIDWRWGEAYFAAKLLDYDLSANNGNWQWAAGCGCDAAPYFRVFNPTTQTEKFDKKLEYIKKWNPGFQTDLKPPVVKHEFARERVLAVYKKALEDNN
ncbi:cryptochrome/photolyase family protein [Polluticaenibacter yanchengensis]|uniref:Deoxyribodipyrimidine photo-lyase n=1 Tax=Polluticaenibacter yanchengensis TaxID=3014562 RepID=A0ABT4UM63_9BACT|nr:deoxyribodipyrimidine photo-lyase [Chitinophagaceae bacterium LY-5]